MKINLVKVIQCYNNKSRHYHNLTHIRRMLDAAYTLKLNLSESMRIAILFHDIVYDAKSKTNEEASVAAMNILCAPENDEEYAILSKSSEIIIATKNHKSDDADTCVVLDLDLAELGAEWDRYKYNEHNIRKEFAHVSDEEWTLGRNAFLHSMLDKEHIYSTKLFRELFENKARHNMGASIMGLEQ